MMQIILRFRKGLWELEGGNEKIFVKRMVKCFSSEGKIYSKTEWHNKVELIKYDLKNELISMAGLNITSLLFP